MKTKHTAKVIGKTGSGQPIRNYRGHLLLAAYERQTGAVLDKNGRIRAIIA